MMRRMKPYCPARRSSTTHCARSNVKYGPIPFRLCSHRHLRVLIIFLMSQSTLFSKFAISNCQR
jgi:hypothetical protein